MKITPHKEGRTERLQVRLDPKTKAQLEQLAAPPVTMADVIKRLVNQEYDRLNIADSAATRTETIETNEE